MGLKLIRSRLGFKVSLQMAEYRIGRFIVVNEACQLGGKDLGLGEILAGCSIQLSAGGTTMVYQGFIITFKGDPLIWPVQQKERLASAGWELETMYQARNDLT